MSHDDGGKSTLSCGFNEVAFKYQVLLNCLDGIMKRTFDIIVALIGLVISGPFLAWVGWKILSEDGGPVFYRGLRSGLRGKAFRIYKFRSMVVDAENIGPSSTSSVDSRITRVGSFIRLHKIDELPQLFNVLSGQMSFVGPRPEVQYYTDQFDDNEEQILSVRPGITDWASIWNSDEGAFLASAENPEKAYEELIRPRKIRLQLKYVNERNFATDMRILIYTVVAVVCPKSKIVINVRKQLGAL